MLDILKPLAELEDSLPHDHHRHGVLPGTPVCVIHCLRCRIAAVRAQLDETIAARERLRVAAALRELFGKHRYREHNKSTMMGGYCTCGLFGQTRGQSHDSWAQHVMDSLSDSDRSALDAAPDTSDIPEIRDWSKAEVGKFYVHKFTKKELAAHDAEVRNLALEEAAKVILMDSCDRPTCDIPAHQKAYERSTKIRALKTGGSK